MTRRWRGEKKKERREASLFSCAASAIHVPSGTNHAVRQIMCLWHNSFFHPPTLGDNRCRVRAIRESPLRYTSHRFSLLGRFTKRPFARRQSLYTAGWLRRGCDVAPAFPLGGRQGDFCYLFPFTRPPAVGLPPFPSAVLRSRFPLFLPAVFLFLPALQGLL